MKWAWHGAATVYERCAPPDPGQPADGQVGAQVRAVCAVGQRGSGVVVLDVGEVEADDVGGVAGVGGVGEEADAFAVSDGAQPFGDDVGVAEGAGLAGLVVGDDVGV